MRHSVRAVLLGLALTITSSAWAQWSSDPTQNLVLSNMLNADQVQPKTAALPNNAWYVSWFNNNGVIPNSGYNVYYQLLSANGVQQFPQNGIQVANETGLSSTQDYGLAIDGDGNALLAFQDLRRDPNNPQITVAKMSPTGEALWGPLGIALTFGNLNSNNAPKVTVTTDGYIVVGWTSNNQTVLQKLTPSGSPVWVGATAFNYGVVLQQSEYYYSLADLHAGDNGSVVVSFVANQGFGSNSYLYANKISPSGQLLWGSGNVHVFDGGSLQFGEFPYFVPDGNGGGVFSWYTNSPTLQVYAQHILTDGTEAFGHNGSQGAIGGSDVRVSPSVSYNPSTQETFLFWTEEDSLQSVQGISAQKFNSAGALEWGNSGLVIVPLGNDAQINAENVQIGTGALAYWIDEQVTGNGTIEAVKLDGNANFVCPEFPVSSALSQKARLWAGLASSGLSTVAFQDYRSGNSDIYIQNVNPDCTLGIEGR
ncbi:MAG: hypothetical protein ABSG11_09480 [Candidatus Korobacteraceae bacterium]